MTLINRQQKLIDSGEAVRVIILAGQEFRGTFYFVETDYIISTGLAEYAVSNGIAKLFEK